VNRFPTALPAEAWDQARALEARGGPEAAAVKELLRTIEARASFRREATELLASASREDLHVRPLLVPEALEDLKAGEIATLLEKEGAA
jgi:hypothetical protein